MRNIRLVLGLLLLLPALCRAETGATVFLDATAAPGAASSPQNIPRDTDAAWARWARLDKGRALTATTASRGLSVRASRFPGGIGIAIANNSGTDAARLRFTVRLPRGLWRMDAALLSPSAALPPLAVRTWRMESALLPAAGPAVKTVSVRSGQTLFVRVTETLVTARAALGEALEAGRASGSAMSGRVARALAPVEQSLDGLPPLVAKGNRAGITKKVHRALLSAAQAQAQWKNERGGTLVSGDEAFDSLMTALSEISCAACNLVPDQTEVVGAGGARSLRISVTNAGSRTVPLLSLGISEEGFAATTEPGDVTVFRQIAPGSKVAATFAVTGPAVHGMVQFIQGMGAAVVPVLPGP